MACDLYQAVPDIAGTAGEGSVVTVSFFKCHECEKEKPRTDEFWHKHKKGIDGLRTICKTCRTKGRNRTTQLRKIAAALGVSVRCQECGEERPRTTEFWHRDKECADGFRSVCKICRNKYRAELHQKLYKNPEYRARKLEQINEWQDNNREHVRKKSADWYYENRSYALSNFARYREENREELNAYDRERNKAPERQAQMAEAGRRRRNKLNSNPKLLHVRNQKANARGRIRLRENPAKYQTISRNKTARRRGAEGTHTEEDIARILKQQDNQCYYCKKEMPLGTHTIDHYIALNKGGSNWPDNLVAACLPCNSRKGDRSAEEFIAYLKEHALPALEGHRVKFKSEYADMEMGFNDPVRATQQAEKWRKEFPSATVTIESAVQRV